MIPVNQKWAKEKRNWEHLGKALLEELEKRTRGRIIRSDIPLPDVKPSELSQSEWEAFEANAQQDERRIQYTVPG